jgi:hypothetical protein
LSIMRSDICVIIPTIRTYDRMKSYFENARNHGFDLDRLFVLLVTEDDCDVSGMKQMLDTAGVDGAVYDETRREAWFDAHGLSQYIHLIPAKSHAQTSFGLSIYGRMNSLRKGSSSTMTPDRTQSGTFLPDICTILIELMPLNLSTQTNGG